MTSGFRAAGRGRVPAEGGRVSAAESARERFLGAIAERITPDRIAELHLFPPIRQGGLESGIAVIAAYPEPRASDEVSPDAPPPDAPRGHATPGDVTRGGAAASEVLPGGDTAGGDTAGGDTASGDTASAGVPAAPASLADAGAPPRHHDDLPAPAEPHQTNAAADIPAHLETSDEARERLTVYRATYRWARKGPDRGKWEVEVRAEADAPLGAVEDIVRGVHRRAGGEAEPERLSAAAVRAALGERPWTSAT